MLVSSAAISVGSLLADCSIFATQPDPALYEYTCPTNKQLSWTIKNVTRNNHGDTWRCLVGFTTVGSEEDTFTISVHVPIQNVTMTVPKGSVVTVRENKETKFVCVTSGGRPNATIRWYKDQRTSNTTDDVDITIFATASPSKTIDGLLYITSVMKYAPQRYENGMKIYCAANNSAATLLSAKQVRLNVQFAPTVLQMKNITIEIGASLNVSCPVLPGNPPFTTFKWTRNGDIREWKSQILYLKNTTRADAMIYKCEAKNSMKPIGSEEHHGEDEGIFHLNVLYETIITSFNIDHNGQKVETVSEHDVDVRITCEVDSNPASTIKLMFGGEILKEQTNVNVLTFPRNDVTCLHAGVYTCEGYNGYGQHSIMNVTLFVRCSPRPRQQMNRNLTSSLYASVTLSFTTIAYPEPGPSGFLWHKENGVRWTPLLSNTDMQISSSGLQTNLTISNVSQSDYGQYRVTVVNGIGDAFEQYMYLKQEDITTHSQTYANRGTTVPNQETGSNEEHTDNTAMIVGVTLGIFSAVVVVYAVYVTVLLKRKAKDKGASQVKKSTTQTTYVNLRFKSDPTGNQDATSSGNNADISREDEDTSDKQYTNLDHNTKDDNTVYDVIQKL